MKTLKYGDLKKYLHSRIIFGYINKEKENFLGAIRPLSSQGVKGVDFFPHTDRDSDEIRHLAFNTAWMMRIRKSVTTESGTQSNGWQPVSGSLVRGTRIEFNSPRIKNCPEFTLVCEGEEIQMSLADEQILFTVRMSREYSP